MFVCLCINNVQTLLKKGVDDVARKESFTRDSADALRLKPKGTSYLDSQPWETPKTLFPQEVFVLMMYRF